MAHRLQGTGKHHKIEGAVGKAGEAIFQIALDDVDSPSGMAARTLASSISMPQPRTPLVAISSFSKGAVTAPQVEDPVAGSTQPAMTAKSGRLRWSVIAGCGRDRRRPRRDSEGRP